MQSPDDYTRGYPIDRRREEQVDRLQRGLLGDFEFSAARVVARLTGARVVLQDDGSRDGIADLRIEYSDQSRGYVEVWIDIEPDYARTWSRLRRGGRLPQELHIATLRRDWQVTVSGASQLRMLEAELEELLVGLETRGETFERLADLDTLRSNPDLSVRRLLKLGAVRLFSTPLTSADCGVVRLYPDGIVGRAEVAWGPVVDWIGQTLASPRLTDVRAKLARTEAEQRHVFLGVTFTSPVDVFFKLSIEEQTLPSVSPRLPAEITHVWLMHAPPHGRCLAWFPDRGWLDVMRHWMTD